MASIGENIRNIRNSYRETQKNLGDAIGISDTAVANYERGDRQPSMDVLQLISSRYGVTVDQLIHGDFSESDNRVYSITSQKAISYLESILPIIRSDVAMEDPCFKRGFDMTVRFWNEIKKLRNPLMSNLTEALEQYRQSLDEYATVESAGNTLWVLFLTFQLLPDEHVQRVGEAVLNGEGKKKDFTKNYLLKATVATSEQNQSRKQKFISENHELIIDMIKLLKNNPQYTDLGDYYLALQYVIGIVDTDYSTEMNQSVGMALMTSLLELDNPYAFTFIDKTVSL